MICFFGDVTGLRLIGDVIWCNTFFYFRDVIGLEQVWWLSINLQSNKVIVFGQISHIILVIKSIILSSNLVIEKFALYLPVTL